MQAKMASAGPLKVRLYQAFFKMWFPLFLLLVRFPKVIYPTARFFMWVFSLLRPNYVKAVASNYSVVLPGRSKRTYRKLARRMFDNHSRYWIEFFRYAKLPAHDIENHIVNPEENEKVFGQIGERGAILITAHIGNWELGGVYVSKIGRPTNIVYVRDRFNIVESFRSRFRGFGRVNEIPVDRSLFSALPALRALEAGELLALQGDRDFNDNGIPGQFFGRTCYFPEGPHHLALMARVPVIPIFFLFDEKSGQYRIKSYPALEVPRKGPREARVRKLLQQYLHVLENVVRQYPDQWYAFYPFFEDQPTCPEKSNRVQERKSRVQA